MPERVFPKLLLALLLSLSALPAQAVPLATLPENSSMAEFISPEVVPEALRQSLSQQNVASLPELILLEQSERLREAVTNNPSDQYALHALGTVTFHLGGDAESVALWQAAARRDPNLTPAEVMQAVHKMFRHLAKGESSAAEMQLKHVEDRYKDQPHFLLMRAEQAMRTGNFSEAEKAFMRAHELAPGLYVTALNLARFLDFSGREPARVLALYQEGARLAPERAETWFHLGSFQFRQGDGEAALGAFKRVQALLPAQLSAERRLAVLAAAAGNSSAAEHWYRKALGNKPSADEAAQLNAALGDALLRQNKVAEARKPIEAAIKHREELPLVFALGTIDEAEGKNSDAERRYRRVLALAPENPLAANNLAMLQVKTGRTSPETLELSERARKNIAGNVIIESTYGCVLSELGRYAEAIEVLKSVATAAPSDPWAAYCLGRSLAQTGNVEEAGPLLSRVLELDPAFSRKEHVSALLRGKQ